MRRFRTGDLLIEVQAKTEIGPLREIVEQAIGDKERIRTLQGIVSLELRGLDPVTEDKDLREGLEKALKLEPGTVELKSVRVNNNDGTRTGIFVISAKLAQKIKDGDRVKVGYVVTRVRVLLNVTRCYKYHRFGHIVAQCKLAIDGREICRRCGNAEHNMAECTAQVRARWHAPSTKRH